MQHGFFFYAAVVGLVALEAAVSGHALSYPASYHSDRAALATVTGSPLRARNYPSYFLNNSTEPPCPTGTIAPLRWVRRQVPLGTATSAASSSQSSPMPMLPTPPSNINRRSRLLGFFNKAALARRNHVPLFPLQNSSMPVGPTGTGSSTAYTIASHGGSYPLPTPVAQIQVQGRSVSDATPVVQVDDGQVQASASLIRPSQHPTAPPYPVPNSTHVASTAAGPSSLHIISSERPTTITLPVTSTISSTVVCPSADASSVSHVATLSGFSAAQSVASVAMSTLQVFASQIDDGQIQAPTASAPVSQIESQGAPLPPAETPAPPSAQEASPPPPSAQEASPPPSPAQEASPPPPPPPPAQEAPPPPLPAPEAPAAPPPQAPTDNYTPPSPSASSSSSGTNPDNATPTVQQGTVAEVPKTADAVAGLENKTKGSLFAFVVALAVAVLI